MNAQISSGRYWGLVGTGCFAIAMAGRQHSNEVYTYMPLYPLSALHTQSMLNLVNKDKLELGMLVGTVHVQCNQVRSVPSLLAWCVVFCFV